MKRNFLLTSFLALLTLVSFAGNKKNSGFLIPLATPTGVTATNTFQGGIKIDWTSSVNPANGFSIEVSTNGSPSVTLISVPLGTARTHTILATDVTPNFTNTLLPVYTFKVKAEAATDIDDSPLSAASTGIYYFGGLTNTTDLIAHANTVTYNSVQLQWTDNNGNNEDGYEILYGETVIPVNAPAGHTNYSTTVTGLAAKTPYTFKVRAFKMVNGVKVVSTASNPASITTKVLPAAAPVVFFTNNCPTLVGVNWTVDRPEDVETFIILRSFGGAFDVVGIKTKGESVYYDLDARAGMRTYYRVVAINESSPNGQNSIDKFIDVTPYSAPPAPDNVRSDKALRTGTSLTIKWNNPNFDNVCKSNVRTSNYVMYKLSTETDYKQFAILNASANSVVLNGLKPKDIVDFRIFSFSDQGKSSAWVGGRDTTLGPPYAPSGLKAVSGLDALSNTVTTLTWEDNANDEYLFAVEASSDNVTFKEIGRRIFNNEYILVKYLHTPVEEGVRYYYRVRSINDFGISDPSPVASIIPDYTIAPAAPYGLKARLVSGKVVLTWYDDSYREENIVVEKSSDNGATYVSIATLGRNILTFTDENVAANAAYKYRVKAVNPKGSSPYSKIADLKAGATVSTSGVLSNESVSLYPNPTADFVNIKIPSDLVGKTGKVLILDKSNRVVLDKNFNFDSVELNIDIKNYTEGVYNVIISSGNSKVSKKVYKY